VTEQDSYKANMDFVSKAVAYNAYLVDCVRMDLGDRVLDIGCGIGNTTRLLDRPFVVGMDVSTYYIEEFKKRVPDVEVIQADIATLGSVESLRDYGFDTIFSSNVIEHIEDDRAALSNMFEILAPGGRLVLLVPNYPALYGSMDSADLHFRRYDRETLTERVLEAGFRLEKMFCLNFPGIFWWYVSGKLLRRPTNGESEAGLINHVMPAVRLIDRMVANRAGLSLVAVARK
jgi:SAM-dependent methyltransferase